MRPDRAPFGLASARSPWERRRFMKVCGKDIQVEGGLIRIARLGAEGYEFLEDPEAALAVIQVSGVRIDLFTFIQKLPHTSPRYGYPREWDNVAALPVSTFDHWWTRQINDKTRNMVRRAENKGVAVREVPFDDSLVQGISTIYNESRSARESHSGTTGRILKPSEGKTLPSSTGVVSSERFSATG